ncbi:hypothetical protein SAMN05443574_1107 [Haloarcula vallismortis]|uniref:DUF8135 domain-containing protein n=2 Tax=Haloarcula vallismortis TaxID=28442 RepID=M0JLQ7_HALVA|nr:hypothetical protein [Haloarcula vallismortis]EMA10062.1 hypothetical protein C437_03951 [Haloarcula vallismortis ATCC 29715]SDW93540.1 hypothetical protein SAMN05443574_1107 [Haloarcula vallismortis]
MSDDKPDPFEALDDGDDREGDPFERLGSGPDDADGSTDEPQPPDDGWTETESSDTPADDVAETGPSATDSNDILSAVDTAEFRSDSAVESDSPIPESSPGPDDPFSGMDDRSEDPFGSGESAFERVDVDHIDADKVWAEIAADDDSETTPETRYAEVSKHRYCEQCEHFSAPPNAHCTNEGTEIMEFLDMETVRLLDCPVVAEQHEIEGEQ